MNEQGTIAAPRLAEADPITVEVLRSRLEAIGREAGLAVERTAISPVVSETKDYSVTISDARGRLVTGVGYITGHFGASVSADIDLSVAMGGDHGANLGAHFLQIHRTVGLVPGVQLTA